MDEDFEMNSKLSRVIMTRFISHRLRSAVAQADPGGIYCLSNRNVLVSVPV